MSAANAISSAFSTLFLLVVLSYYALLLIRRPRAPQRIRYRSVTVLVPARNEERHLPECLASVLRARFPGEKQVIVIDDASRDRTAKVAREFKVEVVRNARHLGKSASLNKAMARARGDLIAIVDGDSVVSPDALIELARELSRDQMAAATAVVKARNRARFLNPWVHLELLYASLLRSLFTRINANIVTPGALSMYRADALRSVGGFSTEGFSEDLDIALRLVRQGYRIGFTEEAVSETYMPQDWKGFLRQRTRFARGAVNIMKRHLQLNSTVVDLYTMPLFLFWYLQAVVMGAILLTRIITDYVAYFASQGVYLSWGVLKFLFDWFSIWGTLKWTIAVLSDPFSAGPLTLIGVAASLLAYPLFLLAILKYDRRIDPLHLLAFVFMFPFWFLLMLIYLACTPEIFRKRQYNRWKKNE